MKRFLTNATKNSATSLAGKDVGINAAAGSPSSAVEELKVASLDNTNTAESAPGVSTNPPKVDVPAPTQPVTQLEVHASAPASEPLATPAASASVLSAAPAGRRKKQKCNKAGGGSAAAAPAPARLLTPANAVTPLAGANVDPTVPAVAAVAGSVSASAQESGVGNTPSPDFKAQTATNITDPALAAATRDGLKSTGVAVEQKAEVAQKETSLPSNSSSNSGKSSWASLLSGQQASQKVDAKGNKGRKSSLSTNKQGNKDSKAVTTVAPSTVDGMPELPSTALAKVEADKIAGLNVVEVVDLSSGSDYTGSCVSSSISIRGDSTISSDSSSSLSSSARSSTEEASSGSSSSSSSQKAVKVDVDLDDAALLRANLFFLTAPQRARRKELEAAAKEKVRAEERKQEQRRVTELLNANKRASAAAKSGDSSSGSSVGGGVSFFAETAARIAEAKKAAASAAAGDVGEGNGDSSNGGLQGPHRSAKGGRRAMWPEVLFPSWNHVGAQDAGTSAAHQNKKLGSSQAEDALLAGTAPAASVASASENEEAAAADAAAADAAALVLLPTPASRPGATAPPPAAAASAGKLPEVALLRGRSAYNSSGADPIEVLVAAATRCGVSEADALSALKTLSAVAYSRAQAHFQPTSGGGGGGTEIAGGTAATTALALKPVIDVDSLSSDSSSTSNVDDISRESVLKACPLPWCDLYRPTKAEDFKCRNGPLPHTSAATRLAVPQVVTWLREWKAAHGHTQAAALSSSANQKNKNAFWLGSSGRGGRGGASYNNDDNYYSDGDSDDEDSGPGNACLLHGPPGVGKTAAVYALAEQLGFHVIEVHAGQARNGAAIQNLLFEATQSRHVDFSAAQSRDFYSNQAIAAVSDATAAPSLLFGGKQKSGKGGSNKSSADSAPSKKPMSAAAKKKAEAAALAAEAAAMAKAQKDKEKAAAKAKALAKSLAKLTLILFEEVDAAWALEQASAQEKANHASNNDANHNSGSGSSGSGSGGGTVARGRVAADDDTAANGVDLGFFASLKMLIKSAKCPIVLTANSVPQAKDFERLKCRVVPLAPPPLHEVTMQLCTVGAAQKLSLPGGLAAYDALAREAHGDLRACLHTLMLWADHTATLGARSTKHEPDAGKGAGAGAAEGTEEGAGPGPGAGPEFRVPAAPLDDDLLDLAAVRWGREAFALEQVGHFSSTTSRKALSGNSSSSNNNQMEEDNGNEATEEKATNEGKSAGPTSLTGSIGTDAATSADAPTLPWLKLLAPPKVTHVVPSIGPLEGGGCITVHGEGFTSRRVVLDRWLLSQHSSSNGSDASNDNVEGDGASKELPSTPTAPTHVMVLVGGQPCSDVTWLSDGKVKCVVPHGVAAGACEVEVIIDGALKPERNGSHASSNGGVGEGLPVYWYLRPNAEEYDEGGGNGGSSTSSKDGSDDDDISSDNDERNAAAAAAGKGLRGRGRPSKGGTKAKILVASPAESDDFVNPTPVVEEQTGSRLKVNAPRAALNAIEPASAKKASLSDSDDDFESPLKQSDSEKATDHGGAATGSEKGASAENTGKSQTTTTTPTEAAATNEKPDKAGTGSSSGNGEAGEAEWVQCDKCAKWRVLPPSEEAYELPEGAWYCRMNSWNTTLASCDAPEEGEGERAQSSHNHDSIEQTFTSATTTANTTKTTATPAASTSDDGTANNEAQDQPNQSSGSTVVPPVSRAWPPPARLSAFRGTRMSADDAISRTVPKDTAAAATTATTAAPRTTTGAAAEALQKALAFAQRQAQLLLPLVEAAENASFVDCAFTSSAHARDCDGRDVAVLPRAVPNGGGASAFGDGGSSLHGQGASDPWWGGAAQGNYGDLLGPAGLRSSSRGESSSSSSSSDVSSSSSVNRSGFSGIAEGWGVPLVRRDFPQPGVDLSGGVAALNTYGSVCSSGNTSSGGASLLGANSSGSGSGSGSGGVAGPAGAAGDGDPAWFPTSGTLASLPAFAALLAEATLRQAVTNATGAVSVSDPASSSSFSPSPESGGGKPEAFGSATASGGNPHLKRKNSSSSSSAASTEKGKNAHDSAAALSDAAAASAATAVNAANFSDDGEFHASSDDKKDNDDNDDNDNDDNDDDDDDDENSRSTDSCVGTGAAAAADRIKRRPWGPTRTDERQFTALQRARAAAHASLAGALVPHQGTGLGGGSAVKARKLGALGSRVPSAHSGNDQRLGAAVACSITDARLGLATAGSSSSSSSGGTHLSSSLYLDRLPYLRNLAVIDAAQRAQHMKGEDSSGRPLGRRQRRRHLPYLEAAGVGTGGGEEQRVLEASALHYPHLS